MKLFFTAVFLVCSIFSYAQNAPMKAGGLVVLDGGHNDGLQKRASAATAARQAQQPAAKEAPKQTPAPAPKPAAPAPLTFGGEAYKLGYSVKDVSGMWLNEYFRAGDSNFDTWQKMLGLYYYEGTNATPLQIAQSMAANLAATNPAARHAISQNDRTGDILLDFFTWTPDQSVIEFNVFKFSVYEGKTIALQFARRWYNEGEVFMTDFKDLRPSWVSEMSRAQIPLPVKQIIK